MKTKTPTSVWIVPYRGKRGTTYRLRWINPRTGEWEAEACGRDLAYARERRDQVRQELRDGLTGKLPETTVQGLIDQLPVLMAGKSATHTIPSTQGSLRELQALCKPSTIADIDRAVIMSFRSKRLEAEASVATVNKDLRQIRSALSYAVDAGLLRANPLLRWKQFLLKEPELVIRVVEEDEFAKLYAACDDTTFKTALQVAYRGGLRRKELVNLRWDAVRLDESGENSVIGVVNVPEAGELTKSRKNRMVPMHPLVHRDLTELWNCTSKKIIDGTIVPCSPYVFCWPDGRQWKPDWVSRTFRVLVKGCKIASCTLHDLRRSFSTLAQRRGVDKFTVKDLGGWSEVSVVERHYTGEVPEVLRNAMKKIAGTA
ncbi:MAG: site-specific tyrosine recombinase XerC [Planctomycetes bacterium ADurb.Bin126]|nr:MAG: site-specific tyrosine recombinase XerC [Planctomycetes bacterium ADurb.Bin126]